MPRRQTAVAKTPPAPPSKEFVTVRTKGLQLVAGLNPTKLTQVRSIDTPEGYLAMDGELGRIRNGRAQWLLAMAPIRGPHQVAIQKQKEALAAVKKAADAANALFEEVDAQFERLERHAKGLMETYKVLEARRIRESEEVKRREAETLRQEAAKKAQLAASARTSQLRARLEQQRADLEARAETAEEQADVAPEAVKGASSVSRTQRKVRVVDPVALFHAVKDYQPVGGVYQMGVPPLAVVEVVQARLNELFRSQPGVVASWPGIEDYDDITIAGR